MDLHLLRPLGRTLMDEESAALCMDWSASGFDMMFDCGDRIPEITASFSAIAMDEPSGHFADPSVTPYPVWPRIAVFLDDLENAVGTFMIDQTEKNVQLLPVGNAHAGKQGAVLPQKNSGRAQRADEKTAGQPEAAAEETASTPRQNGARSTDTRHRLRVIKLTENVKCGLALKDISVNGQILPFPDEETGRPLLEVIGDSITCGFGNMTEDGKTLFLSEEEDIRCTYAYLTAHRLGMDLQVIGASGFCLDMKKWTGRPYCIDEMYEYTDRPRQELWSHEVSLERWDFSAHPASIVVLNIGTNDGNGVNYAADPYAAEKKFREDYLAFIRKLRRLNGPDTKIICALGDMEYFLFDDIRTVYEAFQKETGDQNIFLLKFRGMRPGEPRGAANHPSGQTHERFAKELTDFIAHILALPLNKTIQEYGQM